MGPKPGCVSRAEALAAATVWFALNIILWALRLPDLAQLAWSAALGILFYVGFFLYLGYWDRQRERRTSAAPAYREETDNMDDDAEDEMTPPDDLPEPGRSQYIELSNRRRAKLDEAVSLLAFRYSLGEPANLPAGKLEELRDEVEELLENWDGADIDSVAGVEARTPLQLVLKDCHELGEQMMDVVDEAILPDDDAAWRHAGGAAGARTACGAIGDKFDGSNVEATNSYPRSRARRRRLRAGLGLRRRDDCTEPRRRGGRARHHSRPLGCDRPLG